MKGFRYILYVALSIIVFNNYSPAQNNSKEDSLIRLLVNYQDGTNDINVLNILISLSDVVATDHPEKALNYLDRAKSICLKIEDKYYLAIVFEKTGTVYEHENMNRLALEYYVKSYSSLLDAGKNDSVGYLLTSIAKMYSKVGVKDLSVKYFNKALQVFKKKGDIKGVVMTDDLIGNYFYEESKPDSAITYYLHSLDNKKIFNKEVSIANSYNNLGKAYFMKGDFTTSVKYINLALDIVSHGQSQNSEYKDLNFVTDKLLGEVSINLKEFDKAYKFLTLALDRLKNNRGKQNELASLHYDLGELFFQKGKIDESLKETKISLEIADTLKDIKCKEECYLLLSDIYHLLGQHEVAFSFQSLYQKMADSTGKNHLYEKESVFDATLNIYQKEKELEIKEINLEKERIKTSRLILLLSSGFAFLFIISLLLFNLNRRKKIDNKLLSDKNTEILEQKNEIQKNNSALVELLNEKIKIEDALKNANQFNKEIISNAGEGIVVYNDKFEYVVWNKFMEDFTGIRSSEIIGKNAFDVYPYLTGSDVGSLIRLAIEGDYCVSSDINFHIPNSGRTVWLIGTFVPHYDSHDKIIGVISTIQDISSRKKAENELKKAKEKAEEADYIKSAFLANMSHEIRTPLNAIIGFTSLIKKDSLVEPESKKYLEIIHSSGFHLLNLINDIIDLSKIEAGYIKINEAPCFLKQMLLELFNTFHSELAIKTDKNINIILNYSLDNSNQQVLIDDLRLKQILTNLLSNSVKFTKQGTIEFGVRLTGNNVFLEFYVKDSGIGISEDQIKIIFERFRQADESTTRKYGGSGLGLAISRELVKLMNGNIWVASQAEKGSTFYFTVPFKPLVTESKNKTEEQNIAQNYNWESKTILIVDDIEDIHLLYKNLLRKTKIKILIAENGNQAVEICNNTNIDIVLMDIKIQGIDGYEATKLIKSGKKNLPVIAQTAYAFPEDRQKCAEAGCDDFIAKPVQAEILFKILARYLEV